MVLVKALPRFALVSPGAISCSFLLLAREYIFESHGMLVTGRRQAAYQGNGLHVFFLQAALEVCQKTGGKKETGAALSLSFDALGFFGFGEKFLSYNLTLLRRWRNGKGKKETLSFFFYHKWRFMFGRYTPFVCECRNVSACSTVLFPVVLKVPYLTSQLFRLVSGSVDS